MPKKLHELLGINPTYWRWQWLRLRRWFLLKKQKVVNQKNTVTYGHKSCPSCGGVNDRRATRCYLCNTPLGSWELGVVGRVMRFILPSSTPVTTLLLLANMMVASVAVITFGFSNLFSPTTEQLYLMGAFYYPGFTIGEYWRFITCGYLHIGVLHLAMNLIALSQVGPHLEKEVGTNRFFVIYTLSLLGGSVLNIFFRQNGFSIVAGASGAIMGLIGFGMSHGHFYGGAIGRMQRNFYLKWALYTFLFGYMIRADNLGHGGGFVTGAVLGALVYAENRVRKSYDKIWNAVAGICALVTIGAFIWMIVAKGSLSQ